MKTRVLLPALTLLFACSSSPKKTEGPEDVFVGLSALEYLDRCNDSFHLYQGTPTHVRLMKSGKRVPYTIKHLPYDAKNFRHRKSPDSIRYVMDDDSIHIYRYLHVQGRCLGLFPYLEQEGGKAVLMDPEVLSGDIEVVDGDTSVVIDACDLIASVEFHFVLPKDLLPLAYRGKILRDSSPKKSK